MSKLYALLFVTLMGSHSSVWADWNEDCAKIQSEGPAPGMCDLMRNQIESQKAYAPIRPFHDTSVNGSGLSGKFPWGSPTWASAGGKGGTDVLSIEKTQKDPPYVPPKTTPVFEGSGGTGSSSGVFSK